jgi:hypothetical protein
MNKVAIGRQAMCVSLVAVTLDELYTIVFWLILGREERRKRPYAELKYFGILGQLSIETVLIAYLYKQLRRVQ